MSWAVGAGGDVGGTGGAGGTKGERIHPIIKSHLFQPLLELTSSVITYIDYVIFPLSHIWHFGRRPLIGLDRRAQVQ